MHKSFLLNSNREHKLGTKAERLTYPSRVFFFFFVFFGCLNIQNHLKTTATKNRYKAFREFESDGQ